MSGMIGACLRRGLAAGLVAGSVAGLVALFVGEPSLDAAIALEGGASPVPRAVQKAGLVVGSGLAGVAVGALFAIAAVWAVGRVAGDTWTRSVKLGAVFAGALVLLPALASPASPPGVGEAATVGARTGTYVGVAVVGLLLAGAAWALARHLATTRLSRPVRQVTVAAAVVLAAALLLAAVPPPAAPAPQLPADLLWRFRLASVGTQLVLHAGTAVVFGLLSARAERASVVA